MRSPPASGPSSSKRRPRPAIPAPTARWPAASSSIRWPTAKNAKARVIHIEGDPDHPVNRGTLCPRGAASLGYVHSANRLKYPMHRKPGTDKFERVSWDFAMDRIAKLMKEDRDKNFIAKNRDGVTVNRWLSTGFLGGSSRSNEAGYLTYKVVRSTGILGFENQARI